MGRIKLELGCNTLKVVRLADDQVMVAATYFKKLQEIMTVLHDTSRCMCSTVIAACT